MNNSINAMMNELATDYKVWIGLTDIEIEEIYIWADGTFYDLNNVNWASRQGKSKIKQYLNIKIV